MNVGVSVRSRLRGIAPGHAMAPLALLFGINAVDELDAIAFTVLLPEIRDAFDLSLAEVGAISAASIPVAAAVGAGIAFLGDRRRRTLIAGAAMLFWAVCAGLTGLAWAVPVLVVARIGGEIGRRGSATHVSLLADWYRIDVRSNVFHAYSMANPLAALIGPVVVGVVAAVTSWRASFIVLVAPAVVLGLLAVRRSEPRRGELDRLTAGADEAVARIDERPPGFGETYRVLVTYGSIRRFWSATPFFLAGSIGFQTLAPTLLADEFGLSVGERGLVFSAIAPGAIAGMLYAGPRLQRTLDTSPRGAGRLIALSMAGTAAAAAGVALAPWLGMAIVIALVLGFLEGAVTPGLATIGSLVVPARMRTLGLALSSLFALIGLAAVPLIGATADRYGVRAGMVVCLPLFLVGAWRSWQAAETLRDDMRRTAEGALSAAALRHRRAEGQAPLLSVRSLEVTLGGACVLPSIDLDVADGEILALVGTNGAGKSTLLRAIAGAITPTRGSVVFDGHEVTGAEASAIAAMGVRLVVGGRGVGGDLTVAEHLRLAGWLHRNDRASLAARTEAALEVFPALRERFDVRAAELSGGEQQMLALAAALIARPRLLLVDELSLGLTPTISGRLVAALRELHQAGATIVLVEQSVELAARLAARVVFLERGEIRYDGSPDGLRGDLSLVRAVHLGRPSTAQPRPGTSTGGERRLALAGTGLVKRYGATMAVDGVDLAVHRGEVVAVIGPNGAGKSTLLDLLAGTVRADAGQVALDEVDITRLSASSRAGLGIVRSDQHARLWPALSVADAVAVARERFVLERNPLLAAAGAPAVRSSEHVLAQDLMEILERLGIASLRAHAVGHLSSGQRRLVELAVLLAARPKVVLLDEPSAGLAHPEVEELGARLHEVRADLDATMVLVAHDIDLVRAVAERVIVLRGGRVVADGPTAGVLASTAVREAYGIGGALRRRRPRAEPLRAG